MVLKCWFGRALFNLGFSNKLSSLKPSKILLYESSYLILLLVFLYLDFAKTCKAIFNKLHHCIFLFYELTQGGAL